MQTLFRLRNVVKKYDWGSPTWIPALTNAPNPTGESWAELWMGAHSASPSTALSDDGEIPLNVLVSTNPTATVGEATARAFGGIPFLLKLLAAERPLSIQAHPSLEQAGEGWARENAAGLPLDAPNRNYKDSNHKPEILCALTAFSAMCGFREISEIARLLDLSGIPELGSARRALEAADGEAALRAFLKELFALSPVDRVSLGVNAKRRAESLAGKNDRDERVWDLVGSFALAYPEDPALVSPLYLNVLDLAPGEAIYLSAGILHAYVKGFGVELMADSDNVLRGGLTSKHVDIVELTRTLRFSPFKPRPIRPEPAGALLARYRTPCDEFSLAVATASTERISLPEGEPHIVIVTEGSAELAAGANERLLLSRGESAFVAAGAPSPRLEGSFTAYVASVGKSEGSDRT